MKPSLHSALNSHGTGPMVFDLDAYCARINYTGSREVSAARLKGLHYAHVHNVPFENLDIHLEQAISLEPSDRRRY